MMLKQRYLPIFFVIVFSLGMGLANAATGFSDVPVTNKYYKAIMELKNKGLISGYSDGTFKPEQAVNRVEALKIVLGVAKVDVTSSLTKAVFVDIDTTQWYMPYLNKAVELEIVSGYPDGTFKPTQTVNLVENLKMLVVAMNKDVSGLDVPADPYVDAPQDQWYAKYLQFAKNGNLLDVDSSGKVQPDQPMTRGKVAELAYRLLYIQEANIDIYPPQNASPSTTTSTTTTTDSGPGTTPILDNNDPNGAYVLSVNISGMAFKKAEMIIGQGSIVKWTNGDMAQHSVVSDSGTELSGGILNNGGTYVHTFNKLGTFTYHCGVHPSMKGTIIVKPVDQVPTI